MAEKEGKKIREKENQAKIGLSNVGTMTGIGREVAHRMERRRVDALCVQETRWKGAKARCISEGYKMWYCGSGNKRNGVEIVLKNDYVDRITELRRTSDRIIFGSPPLRRFFGAVLPRC